MRADIHDVCDFIIIKVNTANGWLNLLKLQKLVYYSQALHLAMYDGEPLFNGKFQAWIHGPVNRELYDRFKDTKSLYSIIGLEEVRKEFNPESLEVEHQDHIDAVLEAYGHYSGSQLEALSHREEPWLKARVGYGLTDRCEVEIDESVMRSYYWAQQQE